MIKNTILNVERKGQEKTVFFPYKIEMPSTRNHVIHASTIISMCNRGLIDQKVFVN